ncbi:MAG: FAD-binding oxidoreductase [Deltaproteobacteria bacterium]|nr:MAG: FAD-binding oxidoreductase [Deltaproteobacteria bacterium]
MVDDTEKFKNLSETLGEAHVKTEPKITAQYTVDNVVPRAVVFPKNTDQISEVVKFANRENLAIVTRGSGTKMAMGNPPRKLDLVVCTSRMNHMLDVDTSNLTMTVEAGVKFRDIQARLATQEDRCYLPLGDLEAEGDEIICSDRSHSGCFVPIDPPYADKATIGGIIATNSTGPRRLLYNLPRDCIIGIRVVAPNGDVLGSGGKTVKNVSGYDVSKLMVGSMGTLGILCETTLRMLPLPEKMETLLVSFANFSDASAFAGRIFETSLLPAAVEIMNGEAFGHLSLDDKPDFGSNGYVAAIALEAFEPAVDRMRIEMLNMAKEAGAGANAVFEEEDHRSFWLAMSNLSATLDKKFSGFIKAKLNYPLSMWKNIIASGESIFSEANLDYIVQAHAGNGICFTGLLVDNNDTSATDKAVEAMNQLLAYCQEVDGNLVIQSAPADVKSNLRIWGKIGFDFVVMKRLKDQLDPKGIMSPGRFVEGL